MISNDMLNDELNNLILSDETLVNNILIYLFFNAIRLETKEHRDFTLNDYEFYNWYINENKEENAINLKKDLLTIINKGLTDTIINGTYNLFRELKINESKSLLYTLSRLFYLQNKYKDNIIGETLDKRIKDFKGYIEHNNANNNEIINEKPDKTSLEAITIYNDKLFSIILYHIIPSINYDVYLEGKPRKEFLDLWIREIPKQELKDFLNEAINIDIKEAKDYNKYFTRINTFINDTIGDKQFKDFLKAYNINLKNIEKTKNLLSVKEKYNNNSLSDDELEKRLNEPELNKYYNLFCEYQKKTAYLELEQNETDIKAWRDKTDKFIERLKNTEKADFITFDLMITLMKLTHTPEQFTAYNPRVLETRALNTDKAQKDAITGKLKDDKPFLQSTSRQLKILDNARGGLVTYTETNVQAITNQIKEKEQSRKNTHIKADRDKLTKEIKQLQQELEIATIKEKELKDEYKNVCDYLDKIYKSMENEPKTSSYFKDLKKAKKEQEQRKKEIERITQFNGWQLDLYGNGKYELILNKRNKESLTLTIENLSKQIAKYTKEEQDIFDFLINKYLHNTNIKDIKFTLREYEKSKNRVRPDKYLGGDIQAIRLLFREVWTYYTTNDKTFTFNEKHLFTELAIKGNLATDLTSLDDANLDTEISLKPTETLQSLLQDHDNYLYISTTPYVMQLNNDNEYLAKRLIKYLNYLARVRKSDIIDISLDTIISELQYYGLKPFNNLDRHKTFKTEIVDVIDKILSLLESDNHLGIRFIEVLDRQPFINYDTDFRGKSQETSINEWGKQKIKIKVFNLDDTKLLETKGKQTNKNKRATKK